MKRSSFLRVLLLAPLGGQQSLGGSPARDPSLDFLLSRQSADGAWRSNTYGAFRDGRALTPIVLRCLAGIEAPALEAPRHRAVTWLLQNQNSLFRQFPVHLASAVLECAARIDRLTPLKEAALLRLKELQGGPDHAWSYSTSRPPDDPSIALPPMQQPNLSATAIAIDGLRAAGNQQATIERALPFIMKCQNQQSGDPDFDDGGFFQMPLDPSRNKAGRLGTDRHDMLRFRSYAAATSDGLRCLLSAGIPSGSQRRIAAEAWLGNFEWQPDGAINAPTDLVYYTARSLRQTARLIDGGIPSLRTLGERLSRCRGEDGSWRNPAGEMRENCPLVATSLALEASC